MQSKAETVDAYFQEVPGERLEALRRLRMLCQELLTGYDESMLYGMPSYMKQSEGEPAVCFASQKNNIALYIMKKDVLDKYRDGFPKSAVGKGCIRYRNPKKMDFVIISEMLRESAESTSPIC